MKFSVPYGDNTKQFELPEKELLGIIDLEGIEVSKDSESVLKNSVEKPIACKKLRSIAKGRKTVAIVVSDITRPSPSKLMLEVLLKELKLAEINDEDIVIVVATGNHRANTKEELEVMLGYEHVHRYKVLNHNCFDESSLTFLGTTDGGLPVWINSVVAKADIKILTGVITPHHAAGFSGGRKSIMPGVAGIKSLELHHSFPIRPFEVSLGKIEGNTFHQEALKAAKIIGIDFILNVVLDNKHNITAAVAGDLDKAHLKGVDIARDVWERPVSKLADISIVSPGGYPRDIDLHQSQKSISCAEVITKPGGVIILVAECRDGIGKFSSWLKEASTPMEVIERFKNEGYTGQASSKAFMFARGLTRQKVIIVSDNLEREELEQMFVTNCVSVEQAYEIAIKETGGSSNYYVVPFANDILPAINNEINI